MSNNNNNTAYDLQKSIPPREDRGIILYITAEYAECSSVIFAKNHLHKQLIDVNRLVGYVYYPSNKHENCIRDCGIKETCRDNVDQNAKHQYWPQSLTHR